MTLIQHVAVCSVALCTLVGAQFPFRGSSQSSGNFGGDFQPFTNFDQYARNSPATTSGFGYGSAPQSSNPSGNYDLSRSFNFDRQSINDVPQGFSTTGQNFQAPRFQPTQYQPANYQAPSFNVPTPTSPPIRYQSAPAQQYQLSNFQHPTAPPQYRPQTFQPRAIANVQPYRPPPTQRPYQAQPIATTQYQLPPAQQYQAPPPQRYQAPQQYQAPPPQRYQAPPPQQYQAPPPQQYQQPEQQRPRNAFVDRASLSYDAAAPAAAPYTPVQQGRQEPPTNSAQRQQAAERPAVVHAPAPVHYVSIGSKLEGDYNFGYDTGKAANGDESFRRETRDPDGTVRGSYGYVDSNGKQITVHYEAGKEGFKILSDDEAKGKREQAAKGQNSLGDGRPQAQGGLPPQVISRPAQDIAVQQSAPQLASDAPRNEGAPRRLRKRRRQRRAVDNDADDEDDSDDVKPRKAFGSRVSSSGSLRPTGSPRPNRIRTRRPINPDGRSLRPTRRPGSIGDDSPPPARHRQVARTRVVIRTTTPLPAPPTARPTVPRRRVIPSPAPTPPTLEDVVAPPPQPKRRRKIRRKFRTTIAPVLGGTPSFTQNQLIEARSPVVLERTPVLPPAPPSPIAPFRGSSIASVPSTSVTPPSTTASQIQRPQQILTPAFLQPPPQFQPAAESPVVSRFNQPPSNPYAQHVDSPQSLYDQLTNSIYQEAGRVPTTRTLQPHQQQVGVPRYSPVQQQPFRFQQAAPSQFPYQAQYGAAGPFPVSQSFQSPQFSSPYQVRPRFQQAGYQTPRYHTQASANQDLYPYASDQQFSHHPSLLSYDIGSARGL